MDFRELPDDHDPDGGVFDDAGIIRLDVRKEAMASFLDSDGTIGEVFFAPVKAADGERWVIFCCGDGRPIGPTDLAKTTLVRDEEGRLWGTTLYDRLSEAVAAWARVKASQKTALLEGAATATGGAR